MKFKKFCLAMPVIFLVCLLSLNLQSQTPVVVNDTVDITPGIPVTIDLLANDTVPHGDSVKVLFTTPCLSIGLKTTLNSDKTFTFLLERCGYCGLKMRG